MKTVGPVKEAFVVYNNQANSKGMAVVSFQRSEDAMVARKKFNGKIIDGSKWSHSPGALSCRIVGLCGPPCAFYRTPHKD